MKYNLKDIGKCIYKRGEIECCGHKGLLSFIVPIIELLVYIKELELRIEQLEKKINSKDGDNVCL